MGKRFFSSKGSSKEANPENENLEDIQPIEESNSSDEMLEEEILVDQVEETVSKPEPSFTVSSVSLRKTEFTIHRNGSPFTYSLLPGDEIVIKDQLTPEIEAELKPYILKGAIKLK